MKKKIYVLTNKTGAGEPNAPGIALKEGRWYTVDVTQIANDLIRYRVWSNATGNEGNHTIGKKEVRMYDIKTTKFIHLPVIKSLEKGCFVRSQKINLDL
jgi:hypothetical protein